ncbi:response regulator transcription factor [Marinobacter sp.]|uniref:response regulator transcription factor n=1 Tax=Marinobacter sp. TaxID=50741 RepID=UPI00384B3AFD
MDALITDEAWDTRTSGRGDRPLSRALIVDDHPFFSDGLASILTAEQLVCSVGKVSSVPAALDDLRTNPDTSLVLLDLTLQGEAGLSLFRGLDEMGLPVPVVVISSREDETSVRAARAAGAMGFMPKSSGRRTLIRMIQCLRGGDLFYPSLQLSGRPPEQLTPRQLDVLRLLADGLPNKRICQELDLTEHTVKTHLKAIFSQLGVHNRTECVAQARSFGLI